MPQGRQDLRPRQSVCDGRQDDATKQRGDGGDRHAGRPIRGAGHGGRRGQPCVCGVRPVVAGRARARLAGGAGGPPRHRHRRHQRRGGATVRGAAALRDSAEGARPQLRGSRELAGGGVQIQQRVRARALDCQRGRRGGAAPEPRQRREHLPRPVDARVCWRLRKRHKPRAANVRLLAHVQRRLAGELPEAHDCAEPHFRGAAGARSVGRQDGGDRRPRRPPPCRHAPPGLGVMEWRRNDGGVMW
mmetsp:Transcript_21367/g.64069  ORF Transcript_21367/g.64069 Transcript_21367/m.64069 type:complete len:245 (+) Transcript_21367:725-1459(+)